MYALLLTLWDQSYFIFGSSKPSNTVFNKRVERLKTDFSRPVISRLKTDPGILFLLFPSPGLSWAWVIASSGLPPPGFSSTPPLLTFFSHTFLLESLLTIWQQEIFTLAAGTLEHPRELLTLWPQQMILWGQLTWSRQKSFLGTHKSLVAERSTYIQGKVSPWNLRGIRGGRTVFKTSNFQAFSFYSVHHVFPPQNVRGFFLFF